MRMTPITVATATTVLFRKARPTLAVRALTNTSESWTSVAGFGIHSGGTRTMSFVCFSDVTRTQTAGVSQSTASTRKKPVSAERRTATSVLRSAAQQPELDRREEEDHQEEHPRHRRGGAEAEEVLEDGLVQVLDHRAGHVAGTAVRQHEHLAEDLERPDDVDHDDEQDDGAQERQRDRPEGAPRSRAVDRSRLVQVLRDVLKRGKVNDEVVPGYPPGRGDDDRDHRRGRVAEPGGRRRAELLQVVIEGTHQRVEQPEPGQADGDDREGKREEEGAAQERAERDAAVEQQREQQRQPQDRQRA